MDSLNTKLSANFLILNRVNWSVSDVSLLTDIRNAISYLVHGNIQEFILRTKVYIGYIDLKIDRPESTPTETTHPYSNSGGLHLRKVLDSLKISPDDAVVDFGSGKGGALITLSQYPFSKITGVEISRDLAETSKNNLRKLGIESVDIKIVDAAKFTDLDDYNFFYMFNPFPGNVLQRVMKNIEASLKKRPRRATIIYFNPEYHLDVIKNTSFSKNSNFSHHPLGYNIYSNYP